MPSPATLEKIPMPDDNFVKPRALRLADGHWDALGRAAGLHGTDRTAVLLAALRDYVTRHGDAEALRLLEVGDRQAAETRARQSPGRAKGSKNKPKP